MKSHLKEEILKEVSMKMPHDEVHFEVSPNDAIIPSVIPEETTARQRNNLQVAPSPYFRKSSSPTSSRRPSDMYASKLEELHAFKLNARGLPDKGVREAAVGVRSPHCFDCAKKAVVTQRFNAMDATGSYAAAEPAVAFITKPKRDSGKSEIADSSSFKASVF